MSKEFSIMTQLEDNELCEKGCIFECKCGVIHDEYYYCMMHEIIKTQSHHKEIFKISNDL